MASEHTFKLLQAECKKKRPQVPGQVDGDAANGGDNRSQPKRRTAKSKAKAKGES